MLLPSQNFGSSGGLTKNFRPPLLERGLDLKASATLKELASQWTNPSDVSTILMVIGADVVQKALAQTTGNLFTPVCFSFGWVAYTFTNLVNMIGDGRLLPEPDYPVKVFNLASGYHRQNRNWVIGRIVRDSEAWMSRRKSNSEASIRIAVYEAEENPNSPTAFSYGWLHLYGALVMALQLFVDAIPIILNGEWDILFITSVGTLLALVVGALPQWTAEKLPNNQASNKVYALTTGNGSRDIVVIKGAGRCLDLEELAIAESPRNGTPWAKVAGLTTPVSRSGDDIPPGKSPCELRKARMIGKFPRGFFITRLVCILQSFLWLLLLINVASVKTDTWFLLAVEFIGMFQNAIIAAMERPPKSRNLPLRLIDLIVTHQCSRPLLREFFPSVLRPDEEQWWAGDCAAYDEKRNRERAWRGPPRSKLPGYMLHTQSSKRMATAQTQIGEERLGGSSCSALQSSAWNRKMYLKGVVSETRS